MKVVAFNGSARKNGNTAIPARISHPFEQCRDSMIDTYF